MKVAMLTTVGDRCGIAAYTRALIEGLQTLDNIEVEVVPITEGRQPTSHYIEQAEKLNSANVDIIHIQHEHSFWGGIMPRCSGYWELRYLLKKPIVLTAHTTYSLEQLLRVKTERRPLKLIAKKLLIRNQAYREGVDTAPFTTAFTIVHTSAARRELIERGVNSAYVVVVPTGVPEADNSVDGGAAFRSKYHLLNKRTVVIFGYIAPNKGYELAMQALISLPQDVVLVIAGGPRNADMEPYVASLKSTIATSGLEKRVVITGYLSDEQVADAMAASDLVLAPHTQATGSYSITLPLTHGRPILASDMDCFKEIRARVNCMEQFESGNLADFEQKLTALLEDKDRRDVLSANAIKYSNKYSWPKVAASTRSVYENAIKVYSEGHHAPH